MPTVSKQKVQGVQYDIRDAEVQTANGRKENAYSKVATMASLLFGRFMPEGTLDDFDTSGMSGTTTSNAAWKPNKATTSGSAFCYTTYTGITDVESTGYVVVTGHSWGADYPLICFYDSSDNLIAYQDVKGDTHHSRKLVMIPIGTSWFVVNGRNADGYRPEVLKLASSTIAQAVSAKFSPYNKLIDSSILTKHADYNYVRNFPTNYIYQLADTMYQYLNDVPTGLTTYATLIKFNPNSSRTSKGYTTYILVNDSKLWFGWDNGTRIIWNEISAGDTFSANVKTGLTYIEATSTTTGKAKHKNGSEASNSTYLYSTFSVNGGEDLLISGYHYADGYPLWIMYDAYDNYIKSATLGNEGMYGRKVQVSVPNNVKKIIVNGANAGSSSGANIAPSIQKYNGEMLTQAEEKRRYLFVGDSYLQGYSHDGSNSGWGTYCAGYMGLSSGDYVRKYYGGARFSANGADNTYEALLKDTLYPYDYFTDIVVCGGYNDHAYTEQNVLDGIESFVALAKAKYPTAKIWIGFVAWNKAGTGEGAEANWQQYHTELLGTTLPAYQKCCTKGVAYLNNIEYWINDAGMTNSDGYHPSATGNQSIARALANALLTGSAQLPHNEDLRM